MFSPLEQFQNHPLLNENFVGVFNLNTLQVAVLFNTFFLLGLTWFGTRSLGASSNVFQKVILLWWSGIAQVVKQQLAQEQRFTPLFVWTFGWIAWNNVTGLIPFGFTVTAQLVVTLFLALGFNLGFLVWGLWYHRLNFFKLFVPSGAPVLLLPLIVLIEFVSYCIRPVSLALRLFANMMAGHTLMHILISFAAGLPFFSLQVVSIVIILGVTVLELGIAFIQAYVFVVLSCIYLKDALQPAH